jgi:hypothetical protein
MAELSRRNKTRRNRKNKTEGGKRKDKRNKSEGGKRRTRKSGGASDWNKKVMEIYKKMKKEDPNVKLGAAMKRASELKKKGQL